MSGSQQSSIVSGVPVLSVKILRRARQREREQTGRRSRRLTSGESFRVRRQLAFLSAERVALEAHETGNKQSLNESVKAADGVWHVFLSNDFSAKMKVTGRSSALEG